MQPVSLRTSNGMDGFMLVFSTDGSIELGGFTAHYRVESSSRSTCAGQVSVIIFVDI
jgi:hypothetical protein